MKKAIIIVGCAVIALFGFLAMTSCGDNGKYAGSPYLGTWKASAAQYEGVDLKIKDLYGKDGFVITFNSDGSAEVIYNGETKSGTWKETKKGARTDLAEEMVFTVDDDGNLKADAGGMILLFEEQ